MSLRPLSWTAHAKAKLRQYRLSEQRVMRVLHTPRRVEEGIAPGTVAYMQPASVKTAAGKANGKKGEIWSQEIWVMVEDKKMKRTIVSAWRYPGMTKSGAPLSPDVLHALRGMV